MTPLVRAALFYARELGWHDGLRSALLCSTCKRRLRKNRVRARFSKPRPADGRVTP
jgi:hypothetical protein